MYLHLGEKTVIRTEDIIGIFDLDNTTVSKNTRDYLAKQQKAGNVINVSYELPKSFIICEDNNERKIYISQLSNQTLYRRILNNGRKL
ncbi:MAG: DUF370 domain-containing protein [Ruminococcus sp.]|nr:DUF370 domain-containing protein [Ruminococcus sp.]